MDRHCENRVLTLAVNPVELVSPESLHLPRTDEPMTVRKAFDEHHRGQVVEVPVGWDLDQIDGAAELQRPHPCFSRATEVDLRPGFVDANVVRLEVTMHLAVVVNESMLAQQTAGRPG